MESLTCSPCPPTGPGARRPAGRTTAPPWPSGRTTPRGCAMRGIAGISRPWRRRSAWLPRCCQTLIRQCDAAYAIAYYSDAIGVLMNPRGNPFFVKGNQLGQKGRGKPKRPAIAHMLQQFAPKVVVVIQQMLSSDDQQDRWTCAKEIMPYLWPKKAAITAHEEKSVPTLADYLSVKPPITPTPPHDPDRSDS